MRDYIVKLEPKDKETFHTPKKKIFNENGMESLLIVQAKWEKPMYIYKQGWKSIHKKYKVQDCIIKF
jgi:hypothetical protein